MVKQGERGVMATKLRKKGGWDGRSRSTMSESQEQGARIIRMKMKSNGNKSTKNESGTIGINALRTKVKSNRNKNTKNKSDEK
jgi:hypothetical protein